MKREEHGINELHIFDGLEDKKYKVYKKQKAIKIVAGVTALALAITAYIGSRHIEKYDNIKNQTAIVDVYGEDSIEKNIFDYIMISEELHNLDLSKFKISDSLLEEANKDQELLSPHQLYGLIDNYKNQDKFIPYTELDNEHDRIIQLAKLIYQEKKVNEYIYTNGYEYVHKNITSAVKNYAAEVFKVEASKIVFDYHYPKGSEEELVIMRTVDDYGNTVKSYSLDSFLHYKIEDKITEGVRHMVTTNKYDDNNSEDNNLYNRERNLRIINALRYSSELTKENDNENLYNASLSEKLVGKSK